MCVHYNQSNKPKFLGSLFADYKLKDRPTVFAESFLKQIPNSYLMDLIVNKYIIVFSAS